MRDPYTPQNVRLLVEQERSIDTGAQPFVWNGGYWWAFQCEILEAVGLRSGEVVSDGILHALQVLTLRYLEEKIAEEKLREMETQL